MEKCLLFKAQNSTCTCDLKHISWCVMLYAHFCVLSVDARSCCVVSSSFNVSYLSAYVCFSSF